MSSSSFSPNDLLLEAAYTAILEAKKNNASLEVFNGLRPVEVKVITNTYTKEYTIFKGVFHGWGVGYEEFETGPGNFSVAIVEKEDGTVDSYPVHLVRFTDR